jgi:hypothetical protein
MAKVLSYRRLLALQTVTRTSSVRTVTSYALRDMGEGELGEPIFCRICSPTSAHTPIARVQSSFSDRAVSGQSMKQVIAKRGGVQSKLQENPEPCCILVVISAPA